MFSPGRVAVRSHHFGRITFGEIQEGRLRPYNMDILRVQTSLGRKNLSCLFCFFPLLVDENFPH